MTASITPFTPEDISRPFGAYHQAVLVENPSRWLFISGQLGLAPDGRLGDGLKAQASAIFRSIDQCLAQAGLGRRNLVRLNTYLVHTGDRAAFMAIRDAWVVNPPPASTLLFVPALAVADAVIEIEAIAAG